MVNNTNNRLRTHRKYLINNYLTFYKNIYTSIYPNTNLDKKIEKPIILDNNTINESNDSYDDAIKETYNSSMNIYNKVVAQVSKFVFRYNLQDKISKNLIYA